MDIKMQILRLEKMASDNPGGVVLIVAIAIALIFVIAVLIDAIFRKKDKKKSQRRKRPVSSNSQK